jgi:DNA-directed RNA polymerase specialized sigma24 family protein
MPSRAKQEPETLDITEENTVQLAQQGNAEAFEHLYRRYSARVYALCLRIVKNHTEAQSRTRRGRPRASRGTRRT